jgi:hypothetical protein
MRHRDSRHRSAGLGLKSVVISKPVPFRWHGWSEGLVTGSLALVVVAFSNELAESKPTASQRKVRAKAWCSRPGDSMA